MAWATAFSTVLPFAAALPDAPRVAFVDRATRSHFASQAEADEFLWVALGAPDRTVRGRLALFVEDAIESALQRRGAAPPGVGATVSSESMLGDQLYRARLLELRGLALNFGSLSWIGGEPGVLTEQDSATLRWWVRASAERTVRLFLDSADQDLGLYDAPLRLSQWLERALPASSRPYTPIHETPDAPHAVDTSDAAEASEAFEALAAQDPEATPAQTPEPQLFTDLLELASDPNSAANRNAASDTTPTEPLEVNAPLSTRAMDAQRTWLPSADASVAPLEPGALRHASYDYGSYDDNYDQDYEASYADDDFVEELQAGSTSATILDELLAGAYAASQQHAASEHSATHEHGAASQQSAVSADLQRALSDALAPLEHEPAADHSEQAAFAGELRAFAANIDEVGAEARALERERARSEVVATAQPRQATSVAPASLGTDVDARAASDTIAPDAPASSDEAGAWLAFASENWQRWMREIDNTRGPKPLSTIERIFTSSYVPLREALAQGVAGESARAVLDTWAKSFEQSYAEAFDAIRVRPKRPTLVLDVPDIALRLSRLHGARSTQLVLVDGLRYDLGLRVQRYLKALVGRKAALTESLLLWSALPTTTAVQLELLGGGSAALKARAPSSTSEVPVARGRGAHTLRRVKAGHRELLKLDVVEAALAQPGIGQHERFDELATETAESLANHLLRLPPRTLVFVFGDHGFQLDKLDEGTSSGRAGGASPEEVLVPGMAWLVGDVH